MADIQLVTFELNKQEFGINILDVQEIIKIRNNITKIPETNNWIEGIINLRNKIIPVVNLKKRIGFEDKRDNNFYKTARIIVVNTNDLIAGFIVDSVSEVLRFSEDSIEQIPELINIKSNFIKGIVRYNDELFTLLDLKEIVIGSFEVVLID